MRDLFGKKDRPFLTKGARKFFSLIYYKFFRRPAVALGLFLLASSAFAVTNVGIIKTADVTSAKVLDNYTYFLTASNTGATTATGVQITDVVPAGIIPVSISNGGVFSAGTITWNLPNLSCSAQSVTLRPFGDTGGGWGPWTALNAIDSTYAVGVATSGGASNWYLMGPFLGYQVNSVTSVTVHFVGYKDNTVDLITAGFSNDGSLTASSSTTLAIGSGPTTVTWDITALSTWTTTSLQDLAINVTAAKKPGGTNHTEYLDAVWVEAQFQSCGTQVFWTGQVGATHVNGDIVNNQATISGGNFSSVTSANVAVSIQAPHLTLGKTASPLVDQAGATVTYVLDYSNTVPGVNIFDCMCNNYGCGVANIPNWNAVGVPTAWCQQSNVMALPSSGYSSLYNTLMPNMADQTVSVDFLLSGGGSGNGNASIMYLFQDGTSTGTAGRFYKSKIFDAGGGVYKIDCQDSTWNQVCGDTVLVGFNPAIWHTVSVVIKNYVFYIYMDGNFVFQCQAEPGFLQAPGKSGVYNDGDYTYYKNFRIGDDLPAVNTVLWDTLPACTSYVSSSPAASSVVGNYVRWNLGNLPGAYAGSVTVKALVGACAVGPVNNTAAIAADNLLVPTTSTAAITVVNPLTKTESASVLSTGNSVTYSLTYTATGGGSNLSDNFDTGSWGGEFLSQQSKQAYWTQPAAGGNPGGYLQPSSNITDQMTAVGSYGRDGAQSIDVKMFAGYQYGMIFGYQGTSYYRVVAAKNYATPADDYLLVYYNGSASVTIDSWSGQHAGAQTTIGAVGTWQTLKVVRAGNQFVVYHNGAYVMTLTDAANSLPGLGLQGVSVNGGTPYFDNYSWTPYYKDGITMSDTVPAGLTFVSATAGGTTVTGNIVNWAVPNGLSAGQTYTVSFVASVNAGSCNLAIPNVGASHELGNINYTSAPVTLNILPCGTPTNTATNSPTKTATNTATKTMTNTATNTPTFTVTNTSTNTPTNTATPTATKTPTNTATNTPTVTIGNTATQTPTNTGTNSPTTTPTNTPTKTPTNTATNSVTNTPALTATNTSTNTATNSMTSTATKTATNTFTSTGTNTPTNTPTNSPTVTATRTATNTATDTVPQTATNTATNTSTNTVTNTATPTSTSSSTKTATNTATLTATNSLTNTPASTSTPTSTNTAINTATLTATQTVTNTPTNTFPQTATNTATVTSTNTPTNTATDTPTQTATPSITNTATNTFPQTATDTATDTATNTTTNTATDTPTQTPTPSMMNTATNTYPQTATNTPTDTATASMTATPSLTATLTASSTVTNTPTDTFPQTATNTATDTETPTSTATAVDTSTASTTATSTSSPTLTATPTSINTATNTATATVTRTPTATVVLTATPTMGPSGFFISKNVFTPAEPVTIRVECNQYPGVYSLKIYNSAGEYIQTLRETYLTTSLSETYFWDGTNFKGNKCATGVYVVYLIEPYQRLLGRVVLINK